MRIAAARPGGDYLIDIGKGPLRPGDDEIPLGRILHTSGYLSETVPLHGALSRGYWRPPTLRESGRRRILARARAALAREAEMIAELKGETA